MRLLTLRFTNINSLAGTWEIDFTNPDFLRSPLFAIIGPTGSGKSTILDAVALALYATTPRISEGRKFEESDACPVMTKGERFTEARLRFESDGIVYASRWTRRIKRTGTMSGDDVELVRFAHPDDEEGEVLTTKISEWRAKVIEVTHMSFDIFTRSVLLAQGAFSNFLKADDDDRANLLEKITGTGIYSDISQKIFERHKTERHALDTLQSRLEGMTLLDDETRASIEADAAAIRAALPALEAESKALDETRRWRITLDRLSEEVEVKTAALARAIHDEEAHEPEARRADRARRAALPHERHNNLAMTRRALDTARQTQETNKTALLTVTSSLPSLAEKLTRYEEAQTKAEAALTAFEPDYRDMLAFDERLKNSAVETSRLQKISLEATQTLETTRRRYNSAKARSLSLKKEGEALEAKLTATQADEALSAPLALIKQAMAKLETLRRHWREAADLKRQSEARRQEATAALKQHKTNEEKHRTASALARQALQHAEQALNALSEGNAYTSTLRRMQTLTETLDAAATAVHWLTMRDSMAGASRRLDTLAARDARSLWWQTDGRPELDALLSEVDERLGRIEAEHPGLLLIMRTDAPTHLSELENERRALTTWTQTYAQAEADVRARRDEERRATQALDDAQILCRQAEAVLARCDTDSATAQARLQACEDASKTEKNLITQAKSQIPDCPTDVTDDELCHLLETRADARRQLVEARLAHQKISGEASERLAAEESALRHAQTQQKQSEEAFALRQTEHAEALGERRNRWGDTDPVQKKTELNAARRRAVLTADNARQALQKAEAERTRLTATVEAGEETIASLTRTETEQIDALNEALMTSGFSTAQDALAAFMTPADILAIDERTKRLGERRAALTGERQTAIERQQAEADKALSPESAETLTTLARNAAENVQAKRKQQIEAETRLAHDNQVRLSAADTRQAIERQKIVTAEWATLNDLIGSQNGKKFRTAAQKVTFRILLKLANEAMRTMTPRYRLLPGGSSGLSLNVIDHDMGSITRTSKNLSGGESFMVSLSLALGLSRMGGEHLRVDTLFLDEGFGTLDEQTLDKALYALETLQKSSGKLIGIISHVKSIRERIDAQIIVTGRPGSGRSVLSGPGVRKIDPS